jgi:acyl carrier protein
MDIAEMRERLTTFVNDELLSDRPDDSILPDSPLFDGGGVDSLAIMRLAMFIERDLGNTMPLADLTLENFASIETLSAYLVNHELRTGTG